MPDLTTPGPDPDPDARFRSRKGRAMALTMATLAIVIFGGVAVFIPGWGPGDRVMVALLGVAFAAFLHRYAAIVAVARPEGLYVRNLFLSRTVPWDEILEVRWPEGDPWAHLVLAEGDTLAVMAVQRADARYGQEEGRRLVRLVESRRSR